MRYAQPILYAAIVGLSLVFAMAAAADCPAHLTVRLHDQRAMVDVEIDGHMANMVLDTGASRTLLMVDAPDRLGLAPSGDHAPEQLMSYGQAFQVRFVHARHVVFAGLTREVMDVPAQAGGGGEAGIDGFFTDERLQQADFDLEHGRVDLYCEGAPAWTRAGDVVSVPLEAARRPFAQATINGQVLRILFDTGSPVSSLTRAAAQRAGVIVGDAPDSALSGVAGKAPLRAWSSHIPAIGFGGHLARDVAIEVVDKPNASADMIAGFDFFLRHRVWIDQKGGRLVFQVPKGAPVF